MVCVLSERMASWVCVVFVYLLLRPLTKRQSLLGSVLKVMCSSACFHLASCSVFMAVSISMLSCRIRARVLGVGSDERRWLRVLIRSFVERLNVGLACLLFPDGIKCLFALLTVSLKCRMAASMLV